jgi:hypothetical protein
MQKCNALLSATLLAIIILSGSASAELRWEAGVKGGANWAQLTGDQISLWLSDDNSEFAGVIGDNELGFCGGIFLTAFFNDFFGLQTEALYIQKGGQGKASGYTVYEYENDNPRPAFFEGTMYAYFDYIEVPLMAVFEFDATDDAKVRLRGYAGTTFGFKANAEVRLEGTAEVELQDTSIRSESIDETRDVTDLVKSFEFGLIFGGAVYWDIGDVDLLIESRWERGLTTIDNTTQYQDIYTSNINLMFGVSVPFGGGSDSSD